MSWLRSWCTNREVTRLRTQVRQLEQELNAANARLDIQQVEIDTLSLCLMRDRARVQAEMSELNLRRVVAEGMPHESTAKSQR